MAFTNTVILTRKFADGLVLEHGTWTDGSSAGTGTITAATSTSGANTLVIGKIDSACFSANGDTNVKQYINPAAPNAVTITCTAGEAGHYTLIGQAA